MSKFIAMGEMMMRLTPPDNLRFEQTDSLIVMYGGDESNVTVSLANLGIDCAFITKLPNNPFGYSAINSLRACGINTQHIALGGERIGLNFYEIGASIRPSRVFYDRKWSSISEADISDFDFNNIFKNADWFHTSGITPALSERAAKLAEKALKTAKEHNVTVSIDLNYRNKLWTQEKAIAVMTDLMKYVDVCIGSEEDAEMCLGFKPKDTDVYKGKLSIEGYKDIFTRMKDKFGFKYIATTLRESYSASDNGWSALLYDSNEFYQSKKYDIHLVDRGGGGSAFSAGLIYGFLNNKSSQETVEFATAASALKQTIYGDFNLVREDEIMDLIKGNVSGRIQR